MKPMLYPMGSPLPRLRFMSQTGFTHEAPEKKLAHQQEIMRQAARVAKDGFIQEPGGEGPLETQQHKPRTGRGVDYRGNFAFMGMCLGFSAISAFSAVGFYKDSHSLDTNLPQDFRDSYNWRIVTLGGISTLCGLTSALLGLGTAVSYIDECWALKDAMKKARALKEKTLQLEGSEDPVEKQLVSLLEKWIDADAQTLSRLIRQTYEAEPEARAHLESLYGGKDKLPSASELRDLFRYFAYRALMDERPATVKAGEPYRVSARALMEKTSLFLKAGLETGELFQFVEPEQKERFGQSFNKLMAAKLGHLERHLSERLETVKDVVSQQVETEQHIRLAQRALVTAQMSRSMGAEKVAQVKGVIEQLKGHQQRVTQALENLKSVESVDALSLAGLNEAFDQLVDHLKLMLTAQDLMASQSAEEEALSALAARVPQESSRQNAAGSADG